MAVFVALLRAVNVGSTGKLAMADLLELCEAAGLEGVKTYIQSGNVVFQSKLSEAKTLAKLQKALAEHMGRPVGVLLRTSRELRSALARNPFRDASPNQVIVIFLPKPPARDALRDIAPTGGEQLHLVKRDVIVHYPNGVGRSKLKLPFAKDGTGRNLNTVERLATMAEALEAPRTDAKAARAKRPARR